MSVAEARRRAGVLRPGRGSTGRAPVRRVRLGSSDLADRLRARRGAADADTDHAILLECVARSLRGGASLAHALVEAADSLPASPAVVELRSALALYDRGASVTAVVEAWVAADPSVARALAGAALALGADVGGARARALDGAADALRDRADLSREVRALSSQARSSALVMVLAPVAFVGLAWTTDRRVAVLMCTTPFGWTCLAGGLVLDAAGAWWMHRLTARVS